jgi:hypothetical protein
VTRIVHTYHGFPFHEGGYHGFPFHEGGADGRGGPRPAGHRYSAPALRDALEAADAGPGSNDTDGTCLVT